MHFLHLLPPKCYGPWRRRSSTMQIQKSNYDLTEKHHLAQRSSTAMCFEGAISEMSTWKIKSATTPLITVLSAAKTLQWGKVPSKSPAFFFCHCCLYSLYISLGGKTKQNKKIIKDVSRIFATFLLWEMLCFLVYILSSAGATWCRPVLDSISLFLWLPTSQVWLFYHGDFQL